jgi:oxepin-CoA hydrolase/3-oxo-5,6-dehydrosuberyl-CoA semialdehyde dehydrogenase
MGGVRGVLHYMQRTAVQGSPGTLTRVFNQYIAGGPRPESREHPFRRYFDDLEVGETHSTGRRTVSDADVAAFAELSGDHFYAHKDDHAAQSIFEKKVAHGYFVLSAAAGLFVDPAPGPVLANYGLENLRFTKPVFPGDAIEAKLTVKQKTAKDAPASGPGAGIPQGVVAWDVEVTNQNHEIVATYTILTLVRRRG